MSIKNVLLVSALFTASLTGCSQSTNKSESTAPANQVSADAGAHDGWWCAEHGVPEEVCAQCDEKLVDDFKAKGDWCKEHDRPESQCFICHPEKEAEFVALYEAKYGTKPPNRE